MAGRVSFPLFFAILTFSSRTRPSSDMFEFYFSGCGKFLWFPRACTTVTVFVVAVNQPIREQNVCSFFAHWKKFTSIRLVLTTIVYLVVRCGRGENDVYLVVRILFWDSAYLGVRCSNVSNGGKIIVKLNHLVTYQPCPGFAVERCWFSRCLWVGGSSTPGDGFLPSVVDAFRGTTFGDGY